jgi:sugar phosphate isomerase/epimerase
MPARGPDHSPIPIRTRIEAVAAAGYVGFGLTRPDLVRARDSIGLGTLAGMLRDNGIRYVQLEWLTDWWTSGAARGVDGCEQTCSRRRRSWVSTTSRSVPTTTVSRSSTRCYTPFTRHVKTTQDAVAFVTEVGNPNGGLLLDCWHAYRGGRPYAVSLCSCRRKSSSALSSTMGLPRW